MDTEIRNSQNEKLDYAFHGDASRKGLLVIIGHGVTGNKDRPWAIALADTLAAGGFNALRFSFSGNGDSEGDFRDSTISKEVKDLGAVIDAAKAEGYAKIVYAGHSMGGAVGVIAASQDKRIDFLISLAGMVYTGKFQEVEFGDQTPDDGFMWDDEECPLSSTFVEDMKSIGDVLGLAKDISVPWLLVHGTEDDVVPIQESHDIFDEASEPKAFVQLPGSNHVFAEDAEQAMCEAVSNWLKSTTAA